MLKVLKGPSLPARPVPALPALWTGLAVTTTLAAGMLTAAPGAAGARGGLAVSRSVMVVVGVAVVGLALLGVMLPAGHKRAPAVLARVDRLTVIVAAGWLAATVVLIVFQVADAAARPATAVGVAVTGVLTTAVHVAAGHWAAHGGWEAGWETLLGTGWGQIVLAKTAALAAIGALGWLTRRRMAASRIPLLRWAGYELTLMALALGAAAALTQAPL